MTSRPSSSGRECRTSLKRRSTARSRDFRVGKAPDSKHATTTAHGFVAAADTLARALSVDAAQWAASSGWRPHEAHLRREVLHANGDQRAEFTSLLETQCDEAAAREPADTAIAMIVTLAAITASPEVSPTGD